MDEKFRENITEYLEKEFIVEDYCPYCGDHSRLIKLYECTERYWRCLACLELIWRGSIPIAGLKDIKGGKAVRWYEENPKPKDLRNYADLIEKRKKEEKKDVL